VAGGASSGERCRAECLSVNHPIRSR
jgi:hypothetical protein